MSSIQLNWTAVTPPGSTYTVLRNGVAQSSGITGTSYLDATVADNTAYAYAVFATNLNGPGLPGNIASVTTPPAQVTGLTAAAVSASQINLGWTAQAGISSYTVRRGGVSIATPSGASYSDTGLTASTLYSYTVAANGAGGQGAQSASASATTQAGSTGTIRPFSGHWIYIDQGVSKDSQFARTQQLVAQMGNDIVGFQYLWKWADLESPTTPGDYSGNWAAAGQAGFQLVHRFADYLRSVGKKMHVNNFSYGGNVGNPAGWWKPPTPGFTGIAIDPNFFLDGEMPHYLSGSAYGPKTSATDGIYGGLWMNSFDQGSNRWSNVRSFMRFWEPAVGARMLALSQNYATEFNNHTGLGMFSPFSESTLPFQMATYSMAADRGFWMGPSGAFVQMRAQWPNVPLRWWGNFLGNGQDMSDYHNACVANKWISAGPDLLNDNTDLNLTNYPAWNSSTNYVFSNTVSRSAQNYFCLTANTNSPPSLNPQTGLSANPNWEALGMGTRNITSDWVWQGKDSNGVVNPAYTNHVGQGAFGFDVEPLDLDASHDDAVGTTHLAHANRLGAFALFWYDLRYNSSAQQPQRNRTDTPHPNLIDQIQSCARGGANVNGFVIPRLTLDKTYPPTW